MGQQSKAYKHGALGVIDTRGQNISVCLLPSRRERWAQKMPCCLDVLVPLVLAHVSFAEHTVFESANEIPVPLVPISIARSTPTTPLTGVSIDVPVRRRWIVRRAGLQSNRRVWIQVASDSLNGSRDSSVRIHGRGSLTACSRSRLCVETLRGYLVAWHHSHLVTVARWLLGRVWRRCTLLVHAIVHGRGLRRGLRWSVELVHLHGIGILRMRRLSCSLFASGFGLLLLLNPRSWLIGRRILEIHWWHEWPRELLLGDKRVQLGLLR